MILNRGAERILVESPKGVFYFEKRLKSGRPNIESQDPQRDGGDRGNDYDIEMLTPDGVTLRAVVHRGAVQLLRRLQRRIRGR